VLQQKYSADVMVDAASVIVVVIIVVFAADLIVDFASLLLM